MEDVLGLRLYRPGMADFSLRNDQSSFSREPSDGDCGFGRLTRTTPGTS